MQCLHIKLVICALFAVKAHFGMGQPSISAILLCWSGAVPSSASISASISVCKKCRSPLPSSTARGGRFSQSRAPHHSPPSPVFVAGVLCSTAWRAAGVAPVAHVAGMTSSLSLSLSLSTSMAAPLGAKGATLPNFLFFDTCAGTCAGTSARLLLASTRGFLAERFLLLFFL